MAPVANQLAKLADWVQNKIGVKTPTPTVELYNKSWSERGVRVLIKRDDQTHNIVQGNKWRKLKYNLAACLELGRKRIVTAGGARSTHILSVAAAGQAIGVPTMAWIRGERPVTPSAVLKTAASMGMEMVYVARERFGRMFYTREVEVAPMIKETDYYVPPGGSNSLALTGVGEMVDEMPPGVDAIYVACGTGGTLAGIAAKIAPQQRVVGVAVLKGEGYLEREVQALLAEVGCVDNGKWRIDHRWHASGYAKTTPELNEYAKKFEDRYGIKLDPVYTVKMMWGLDKSIMAGEYPRGTTLMAVHTGGVACVGE